MSDKLNSNTDVSSHFQFGKNWRDYSRLISDERIEQACGDLVRLVSEERIYGSSFLDVGCGSGLHSLAAIRCGAAKILATDIDSDAVAVTKDLLLQKSPAANWAVELVSIFDISADKYGVFDIVYSWGVLHHTGAMYKAFDKITEMVKNDGVLVIAVYRKTLFCRFWKWEKYCYRFCPSVIQKVLRGLYKFVLLSYLTFRGNNPFKYVREYEKKRGMSFHHDVQDWLGGYPYESVKADDVKKFFLERGFILEKEFVSGQLLGIFGAGCDEFVFKKRNHSVKAQNKSDR
ncbi:MAG: class I SAM-dependent methyltransferase [Planctomycetaceae bacterium]|jgi:2-polyprenyl-6-hydroxyphenyl methylase/3-demethylubiquinone-9 3-methyltransferase|nr:class I SAM-dependent methyltransferase [Planctomycetaceae bacterium]